MRLLDLFCGAGGCAVGYSRAGFTQVYGVDIAPQPRYPFGFVQGDALEVLKSLIAGEPIKFGRQWLGLHNFDAIHASPPCQKYSQVNRRSHMQGKDYPDLIGPTRAILEKCSQPWVIENVEAAPLNLGSIRLCGTSFGLPIRRHRLFESSVMLFGMDCRHSRFREKKYPTCFQPERGKRVLSTVVQVYGHTEGCALWPAALGIDWMNRHEMTQAIPPAYTEYVGRQLIAAVEATNGSR